MEQGEVNQGIAKPPLTNQLKDPVVFDFVVQPTRMWTGQVLTTGTYNIANEMGQRIVETDSPLDPVEGSAKYVSNDPLITHPHWDPTGMWHSGATTAMPTTTATAQTVARWANRSRCTGTPPRPASR